MNIYEFDDYRSYLAQWISSQPGKGRGTLKKWAAECSVHSTLLSQIMARKKEISLELAEKIARSIGLSEAEFDYFTLLILHSRAGTSALRAHFKKRVLAAKQGSEKIGNRIKVEASISEEAKATFYSSWAYSAVRNLSATKLGKNAELIADRLMLPRNSVQEIIHFLVESGLCTMESGSLGVGPHRTHVGINSPHVLQHHQNWRLQALQKVFLRRDRDLFFTFPMSLSVEDAEKIRRMLLASIETAHKIVGPSDSETVRTLNIDFFEY